MFTIWVPGKPQPQGSKKGFIINNKVVLVESSKGLKPWRDKIRIVAQHSAELQELTGAVHVRRN
jgi:Holliday junction resolvase RusA-like endonuclease